MQPVGVAAIVYKFKSRMCVFFVYTQYVCLARYNFMIHPFSTTFKISNLPCFMPFSMVSHAKSRESGRAGCGGRAGSAHPVTHLSAMLLFWFGI